MAKQSARDRTGRKRRTYPGRSQGRGGPGGRRWTSESGPNLAAPEKPHKDRPRVVRLISSVFIDRDPFLLEHGRHDELEQRLKPLLDESLQRFLRHGLIERRLRSI